MKGKSLCRVRLFATPWTTAHQAPPSMGFARQEYWSGVPLPFLSTVLANFNSQPCFKSNNKGMLLVWKSHGQRSLGGYSPKGSQRAEHDWAAEHAKTRTLLKATTLPWLLWTTSQSVFFFFFHTYNKHVLLGTEKSQTSSNQKYGGQLASVHVKIIIYPGLKNKVLVNLINWENSTG